MWRILSAVRRGLGWPRKRSARVADEGVLANAGEMGGEAGQGPAGWGGGLAALVAVARAPSLAVASCLVCQAEEEEEEVPSWTSGRRPRADEMNHLMMHDSMRYRIYV